MVPLFLYARICGHRMGLFSRIPAALSQSTELATFWVRSLGNQTLTAVKRASTALESAKSAEQQGTHVVDTGTERRQWSREVLYGLSPTSPRWFMRRLNWPWSSFVSVASLQLQAAPVRALYSNGRFETIVLLPLPNKGPLHC